MHVFLRLFLRNPLGRWCNNIQFDGPDENLKRQSRVHCGTHYQEMPFNPRTYFISINIYYFQKNMIDLSLNLNAGNIHHLGMMKVPEWKPSIILGRPGPPFFSRPMTDELETSEKSLPRTSSLKPREKSSRAKSEETKAGGRPGDTTCARQITSLLKGWCCFRCFRWGIKIYIWCIVKLLLGMYVLEDQPPNKNNLMLSKWVWTGMLTGEMASEFLSLLVWFGRFFFSPGWTFKTCGKFRHLRNMYSIYTNL